MIPVHAASFPSEGDIIAGKYRVDRVLGAGGMGVVVAAHHIQLEERVALKFLLPSALVSPEAVARFVREARAAARIKNEHVARVTDVGELETGSPYMVMEYLEGSDLSALLTKQGALPVDQAVDFVLQACEALAEAHAIGIVHRDLKPANLFCVQRADDSVSIKVLDFGISKITNPGSSGHDMTKTTALMGSPLYMSPEQMQSSKGVDARTDIWSLGIILFELLTGRPPFDAEAVTELVFKIAMEAPPPLRTLRSGAPEALEQVLTRCLEKDRTKRFQTVGELGIALQEFGTPRARLSVEGILGTLRKAGIPAPPPAGPSGVSGSASAVTGGGAQPQTAATWEATPSGARSGGKVFALIAGVVSLGALGLGATFLLHRGAPTTATVAPPVASTLVASAPVASTSPDLALQAAAPATAPPPVVAAVESVAPVATTAPRVAVVSPVRAAGAALAPTQATHVPPKGSPMSAPPAAAPNASCDPPFTLDDQGRKRFKPECFTK